MNRRSFNKLMGAAIVGTTSGAIFAKSTIKESEDSSLNLLNEKRKVLMHVGCQRVDINNESLEIKARHGVFDINGRPPKYVEGIGWDLDDSLRRKELCEKYGINLSAYHLPLTASGINAQIFPNIMLSKSPQRDREIEILQQMIQVAGKTGIRALFYNTTILPLLRTENISGRGNSIYKSWNLEKALEKNNDYTLAGKVSVDEMFERIVYLLDRILPVAKEYKVQLANHIADPPVPIEYRGIWRWNSPNVFEGVKRFANLYDSPYHGFNLCVGSCAEGMTDPNREIHELIRFVGKRKQIFNIHLRNIKGGLNNFSEVFHDEGDIDLFEVVKTLKEVEYPYMVMPDHVPTHPNDKDNMQGFAFAYGYIKALIQAADR